ncbi:SAM-dependent methyltransferase [Saccharopolyspora rhizosphaerae]|uniref:S-adenosyl-L-methionine-dependent methyltransferase n=1 Tax=Saccharopolyspora rhizosphaerae TaxID=2492662 RepID=A0A426JZW5_9PSEU|nr:SAM-dependent methyltransferase [Saccharopolyspora rhizosphaerae]RRO18730.1 SAM-dependent methyltransferase [Saccharopolyspora rhizosphaerae]
MAEHEKWDVVSGVGRTALWVAVARALETRSESGLIDDPHAEVLARAAQPTGALTSVLDAQPEDETTRQLWQVMALHLGIRTRFFDEYFRTATSSGEVEQAVILAAGLDSRAWRLEWPQDFTLFEIDQPEVLDFKRRALAGEGAHLRCEHVAVRADLRDDWASALLAAGFDPQKPTAWLVEGLLPYLPAEAEEELFQVITRLSAPGSQVALEHSVSANFGQAMDDPRFEHVSQDWGVDMNQLVHQDERTPAITRLRDHGWQVDRDENGTTTAAEYGRQADGHSAMHLEHVRYATVRRN